MTADEAFFSFAQALKDELATADPSIAVAIEKDSFLPPPYISIEQGSDIKDSWLSTLLCQIRLVVRKIPTEPLLTTFSRKKKTLEGILIDMGQMPKYDYTQDPPAATGNYFVKVDNWSPDLSKDQTLIQKVLSIRLKTNSKSAKNR
jgi:hypothetical protein